MTGLLVSPDLAAYLFDPCEPTDTTPAASPGGFGSLCALALLLSTGSALEAQQRRFLVELGAGGLYQSFDEVTDLGSAFGGVGRIGVWLPYHFSLEGEGAIAPANTQAADIGVSVRSLDASLLYNIPVGQKSWAHLRVGGGSTKYGDRLPAQRAPIICGSSGALMAGAGVRVGVTPELFIRGDAVLSRNRSKPRPPRIRSTSPTSA